MEQSSAALVGTAGGVGTTRLSVELAATLARGGASVAVLDAAFDTQGLARHVDGQIDPDITTLVAEQRPLEEGLVAHPAHSAYPGRVDLVPAYAPFVRLAEAKSPAAGQHFESLIAAAEESYEYVLVDTPPIAANQAVAAVHGADLVAAVMTPTERGIDALQRTRGRLGDLDQALDLVVANRVPDGVDVPDADVAIPAENMPAAGAIPAALDEGGPVAPALAVAAESLFDIRLDHTFGEGLLESARRRLR